MYQIEKDLALVTRAVDRIERELVRLREKEEANWIQVVYLVKPIKADVYVSEPKRYAYIDPKGTCEVGDYVLAGYRYGIAQVVAKGIGTADRRDKPIVARLVKEA